MQEARVRTVDADNVADIALGFVKYPGQRQGLAGDELERTDDRRRPDDRGRSRCRSSVEARRDVAAGSAGAGSACQRLAEGPSVPSLPPLPTHGRRCSKTARQDARLFGGGAEPTRPFGPFSKLVGRDVGTLGATAAPGVRLHLDGESLLANVRKASGFVPARITGEVDG